MGLEEQTGSILNPVTGPNSKSDPDILTASEASAEETISHPSQSNEMNRSDSTNLRGTPSLPLMPTQQSPVEERPRAASAGEASSKPKANSLLPPPRAPRLAATVRDFEYVTVLGNGSFSKVLLVRYKGDGKEYALKVMAKQLIVRERKVRSVKRERLILDQLDHPGIIRMHFTFQDHMSLYMGMDCCRGGDLYNQIRIRGRLPADVARFYAAEMLSALEYLHTKGVLHRDVKPENMLLTEGGHIKLADFGSATVVKGDCKGGQGTVEGEQKEAAVQLPPEDDLPEERNGSFVGTAEYISPEALNSEPTSFASDLWALGCVIFHMLEGRPPFRGASEYLTFQKILNRDFSFSTESPIDDDAKALIEGLLQIDPALRLGSNDKGGYEALKQHPFFKEIDFSEGLWNTTAPDLVRTEKRGECGSEGESESEEGDEEEGNEEESEGSEEMDEEWRIAQLGGSMTNVRC